MWGIKNIRLVDFLCENGLYPECERWGVTFFKTSDKLRDLMDSYFIRYTCVPNRLGGN